VIAWLYEDIPSIDPQIVQHKIQTYENVKTVQQKLRPVNPSKATTIKS
jgi:hypothetical protein